MLTLAASSLSWLTLVLGPYVVLRFAARPDDLWDIAYIRALRLGLVSALTALVLALFTVRRMRVVLTVFSVFLVFMWLVMAESL